MEADEKRVQSGFASRSQIILQRGGNPQVVRKQIEQERQQDEKGNLNFSSTTEAKSESAAQPGVPAVTEEPADDESADRVDVGSLYEISGRVYECAEGGMIPYEEADSA